MENFFYKLCGLIIVLNLLFIVIPENAYEKYVRFTVGLIVILTVCESIFHFELNGTALYFDNSAFEYNSEKLCNEFKAELIEEELKEKIRNQTGISPKISVVFDGNKIESVSVSETDGKKEEIIDTVMRECDINCNKITIK